METKLVSIKQAAKIFNFPVAKLYRLVEEKQCPFIEMENLSGSISRKINTRTFSDWLDRLSQENGVI
nr:MAG TPA: Pyocin activator protein PrtN [Caudoviricetes sp.]